MFEQLVGVVMPIFLCVMIGFIWCRTGQPFAGETITPLVLNVGTPALVVWSLSSASIDFFTFVKMVFACLCVLLLTAALAWLVIKLTKQNQRLFLPALIFSNVGTVGIPICLFMYGEQGVALTLGFVTVMTLGHITVGVMMMTGKPLSGVGVKQLLTQPLVLATLAGVVLMLTGLQLPGWINSTLGLLAGIAVPLMLIALGVALASLRVRAWGKSTVFGLVRLVIGLLVGVLVAELFGLTGAERGVVIIESTMPVGVMNYMLAERYSSSVNDMASLVVISTFQAFLCLPLLVYFLR
ncbi:MAG: AEC family transporter [Motiliproteus sp.]